MNHHKRSSYVSFHPPPEKDGLKEATAKLAGDEGTDVKFSTHQITMIPTRFLGVNICLKEVS